MPLLWVLVYVPIYTNCRSGFVVTRGCPNTEVKLSAVLRRIMGGRMVIALSNTDERKRSRFLRVCSRPPRRLDQPLANSRAEPFRCLTPRHDGVMASICLRAAPRRDHGPVLFSQECE